jgi:hypothetical protein
VTSDLDGDGEDISRVAAYFCHANAQRSTPSNMCVIMGLKRSIFCRGRIDASIRAFGNASPPRAFLS